MADTNWASSNALAVKTWEETLFRDTAKESFFTKFMGKDPMNIVQEKTKLEKMPGDKITFGLIMRLTGEGVTEGVTLEGNEVDLTTYDYSLTLAEYVQGVVVRNYQMSQQRVNFNIPREAESALKVWGAEKIDNLCFDALKASPTKTVYKTSGGMQQTATYATAKAAITTASSKVTPASISYMKALAMTGNDRDQTPLKPIRIDGKPHYLYLIHPYAEYDLKQDSTWVQANREAMERGKKNPIFSGAVGVWDGVIIQSHESVPWGTDGGSGAVPYCQGFFMGAQALVWGWGRRPKIVQKTFDYDRRMGHGWQMIAAAGKPKYNSKDWGVFTALTAMTNISA